MADLFDQTPCFLGISHITFVMLMQVMCEAAVTQISTDVLIHIDVG